MKEASSIIVPDQQFGHGGPEMLREFIAETLWAVGVHAAHGCEYAGIGNDGMLQLSIHHMVCCAKAVVATFSLQELNARERKGGLR